MKYFPFILLFMITLVACGGRPQTNGHSSPSLNAVVSTQVFYWTDSSRTDPYYGSYREMTVQIWYPASFVEAATRASYVPELPDMQHKIRHWSREDITWIDSIPSEAYLNLTPIDKTREFSLLVFSPSLGGHRSFYSYYAENLAKEGYVVMGINHKYESDYVVSADQSIIPANHRYHDSLETLKIPEQITADGFREKKSLRTSVLADDMLFCIQKLEELNQELFQDRINFNQIGAWGHSIGGAAAMEASMKDARIKAVANMDGTPPTRALKEGIEAHFLFLEDLTDYRNHNGYRIQFDRRKELCEKVRGDAYRVLIKDINHNSFSDLPFHSAKDPGQKNLALSVQSTIRQFLSDFFDHYLKDKEGTLNWVEKEGLEIFRFI